LGYVVGLFIVFFVGIGLVMYFGRADKTATMTPDPKNSKAVPKVKGIGVSKT
jgi:hypothetical protein